MVTITWDSVTLKAMSGSVIEQCEEQGLSWTEFGLFASEVERATPRDREQDAEPVVKELAGRYAWSYLGEEGRRINQILAGVDPDDEMACLHAWEEHLTRHLVFPFEAEVDEFQEPGAVAGRGSAQGDRHRPGG